MVEDQVLVTEVPSSLKQLARLVVRGFYSIEDTLIIDMLVRNPCMKEDDICELLKFEKKMLRARISVLKNDKFLQVRLRMETGEDGKAQKVNYYFINYKTFVNVVKYKLDLMRKRMETEERDATSRASFKCPKCCKTFTDLEADQLFDIMTGEFRCTYCREVVEEDQSALPKKDSRMQLARFNSQMEPLYELLRQVEGIRLAPEVLEPEPVDINTIRGLDTKRNMQGKPGGEMWSGEATRGQGFMVEETRVDVTIGETETQAGTNAKKEQPIWMVESSVIDDPQTETLVGVSAEAEKSAPVNNPTSKNSEDIMSVLLAHEKRGTGDNAAAIASVKAALPDASDSSEDEMSNKEDSPPSFDAVETMDSDEDELLPVVNIGHRSVPITEINDELIAEMTPQEKEAYIQIYQEYYSHMNLVHTVLSFPTPPSFLSNYHLECVECGTTEIGIPPFCPGTSIRTFGTPSTKDQIRGCCAELLSKFDLQSKSVPRRATKIMDVIENKLKKLLNGETVGDGAELCDFTLEEQNEAAAAKGVTPSTPSDFVPVIKNTVTYIVMAVLFNDEGDVLLMQEAKRSCAGQWYLPAGRMEQGETIVDAVKREVLEETGLHMKPTSLIMIEVASKAWFRFVFAGTITGGSLKTPAQADSESLQAKWVRDIKELNLRSNDVLPIIERGRQYREASEPQHSSLLPALQPHKKLLLRLVVCIKQRSSNRVHVLLSEKTEVHFPLCEINHMKNLHSTLRRFMVNIFGADVPTHKPHGVLNVEHSAIGAGGGDGLCITVLVSFKVPLEEVFPIDKYTWFMINKDVGDFIVGRLPKNLTVPLNVIR